MTWYIISGSQLSTTAGAVTNGATSLDSFSCVLFFTIGCDNVDASALATRHGNPFGAMEKTASLTPPSHDGYQLKEKKTRIVLPLRGYHSLDHSIGTKEGIVEKDISCPQFSYW